MTGLNHPKETGYKSIIYIISSILWIILIPIAVIGFFISIPFVFFSWLSSLYFKAQILGDSVKVSNNQYPEIYQKVFDFCQKCEIKSIPETYVYNSNGLLNAFAVKIFMNKYIMLTSTVVDLSIKKNNSKELDFIIGHELGHHAAGHTSIIKSIFIKPAKFVPFLGAAYSRACELTADRYGLFLSKDIDSSINSLINLAHGSKVLSPKTNIQSFISQENEIPELMGFISKIFSSHPRLTKRVIELKLFGGELGIHSNNSNIKGDEAQKDDGMTTNNRSSHIKQTVTSDFKICSTCGCNCDIYDTFCENCGTKLS